MDGPYDSLQVSVTLSRAPGRTDVSRQMLLRVDVRAPVPGRSARRAAMTRPPSISGAKRRSSRPCRGPRRSARHADKTR
jgi:hypothetical protein